MLILVAITVLLCSSSIQASPPIQALFPPNIDESNCAGAISWTRWFNEIKPSDNGSLDYEVLPVIQAANGRDVCATPLAMQVQSVGDVPVADSYPFTWSIINNNIGGVKSNTLGLDLEVRFCCFSDEINPIPTPTITTTPISITNYTCGRAMIKHSLKSARIFGGSAATANSWPWQVLYKEKKPCGADVQCVSSCGGTLIDDRHVLTAAHCIRGTDPTAITIIAGFHNNNKEETNTRQQRIVEHIFKHTEYNPDTSENDITILRLAQPVQFNKYVQPACLPESDPQPNDNVVLIGWGAVKTGGNSYHELKQAKVKVVDNCDKYWKKVDKEKQICVGHNTTGDSVCQGDSGGPLLYEVNGQWIVAGVISLVSPSGCTTFADNRPNVCVRVSAYLPWIKTCLKH